MSDIEGKVVAITGASSGIGEAAALLLAERGAAGALGARRGGWRPGARGPTTGASGGIGAAAALLLAERGAAVALGARRADRLDALADSIRERGGRAAS